MSRQTYAAAILIALGGPIVGPLAAQDASQNAPSAETVVATVDGTDITLGHMLSFRERLPQQYQQLDDQTLFDGILEQLVQQSALAGQSDSLNQRSTLALDNERRSLLAGQALNDIAARSVTDADIEEAYQDEYGDMDSGTEYDASHILVETEETAQRLTEEARSGADFAELARANSTGPSGPSGGELGWFGPGMMVPDFEAAVRDLEPGQVSDPVQTQFGWHVIRLNDTREVAPPPLSEVRGEIETRLQSQTMEQAMAQAVEGADVTRQAEGLDPSVIRSGDLLGD